MDGNMILKSDIMFDLELKCFSNDALCFLDLKQTLSL